VFVPARDADAFAAAIQDLIDDPDERQQLGQLARARSQLYSPDRMARGMAGIYARLLSASSEPAPMAGAA
jgi:glycosyltransferase involved in cell wall biosynthesis